LAAHAHFDRDEMAIVDAARDQYESIGPATFNLLEKQVQFSVKYEIRSDDIVTIEHAIKTVDADAKINVDIDTKTVSVDSWLMPEEFLVAFVDEDYDVTIAEW
jgi:copper chaperone CopZ